MEYCEVGSLKQHMSKIKATYLEKEIALIVIEVLKGLRELHKSHLIHRDIKADNVFLFLFLFLFLF